MNEPLNSTVVALVTAAMLPSDALLPAAETLCEFGLSSSAVPPDRVVGMTAGTGTQKWRAVIVASADAALPGAIADAVRVPVVRVPIEGAEKRGLALLVGADGDLPAAADDGAPFATVAIGPAGAKNAALFVVSVLALDDDRLRAAWIAFRTAQTDAVLQQSAPTLD